MAGFRECLAEAEFLAVPAGAAELHRFKGGKETENGGRRSVPHLPQRRTPSAAQPNLNHEA